MLIVQVALLAALACSKEHVEAPTPDDSGLGGDAAGQRPPGAAAPGDAGSGDAGSNHAAAGAVVTGIAAAASGGYPAVVTLEPVGAPTVSRDATAAMGSGVNAPAASRAAASAPSGTAGGAPSPPVFMDQIASAFYPPTLLTHVGQTVEFLNSEGVMHNVNVSSDDTGAAVFNIATPPGFEAYPHVFAASGVYRVKCDIHPNMSAFIVAVATPYAAVAGADGRFTIPGVPPGSYQVAVWSLDSSRRVSRLIEVPSGSATVELDLRSELRPEDL